MKPAFLLALVLMLPVVGRGQTESTATLWLPYFLESEGALPTYGASVAVDARGGVHAAYAIFAGAEEGRRPAVYAYCPGNCGEPANWTATRLGDQVQEARVALDPTGPWTAVPDASSPFRVPAGSALGFYRVR